MILEKPCSGVNSEIEGGRKVRLIGSWGRSWRTSPRLVLLAMGRTARSVWGMPERATEAWAGR